MEKPDLSNNTELFRMIIESNPVPSALNDLSGVFLMANNAFYKNLKLSPEEIIGKTGAEIGLIIAPSDRLFMDQTVLNTGILQNFECTLNFREEEHILYISASLVEVKDQKVFLWSGIDVTDKKKLEYQLRESEARLKESNYTLEKIVNERTTELATTLSHLKDTNEELQATNDELYSHREQLESTLKSLQEAQKQLIQTEKMASLGILTAGIAHEINNPINYISNGSQAIENYIRKNLKSHITELLPYFQAINTGIERTVNIISNLNKFSGSDHENKVICLVHRIIDQELSVLEHQYAQEIEIIRNYCSEASVEVKGNEKRLKQAFLNILQNAFQAIGNKGTIKITTSVENGLTIIKIKDTGCGIGAEDIKHIFDPFFTTRDPGKGTGLGLSISQSIIEEHQGTIECKSKKNSGSEFIITLPAINS